MSRWNMKVKEQSSKPAVEQSQVVAQGQIQNRRGGVNQELKEAMEGARQLMNSKRYDEALTAYEAILERYPEAALAYVGVGNIHAIRGEYDDALEYYAGALHLRKDFLPALVMSGHAYAKQRLLEKALEKYQEALNINPGLGAAQLGISRIYANSGKLNEAIDILNTALKHNPQLEEARLALSGIYQRIGNTDAALKELKSILVSDPDSLKGQLQYAKILMSLGEFKQAIDPCKKALCLKSDSAFLHYLLGRACHGAGDYDLALREYAKALEINPDMQIVKIYLVRANMEQGNLPDAKKLLISMTKGTQNLGLTHRLLGDVFLEERTYSEAVAEYRAAVLHSKKLVENYPDFLKIQAIDHEDNQAQAVAQAYKNAFAKIDIESMITREEGYALGFSSNDEGILY